MNRNLIYVALVLILLVAGVAIYELTKPAIVYGSRIEPPKPMPDFTLQSVDGPVKLSDFRGRYVILNFGYTSCPDICPTTLAKLKASINKLGAEKAGQVQVIFISVDHKRDTTEKVDGYVKNFQPDFIGLSGTENEIDQATRDFGIYYQLNEPNLETGSYLVDHTTTLMLLDRQGALTMTWSYDQQPDEIASDLEIMLRQ